MKLTEMNEADLLIAYKTATALLECLEGNRMLAVMVNGIASAILAEITRQKIEMRPVSLTYVIHFSYDTTLPDEIDVTEIDPDTLPVVNCEVIDSSVSVDTLSLFSEFIDGLNMDGLPDEGEQQS